MAISFFQTAWNTNSSASSGGLVYKDLAITGVVSGDLIVVIGVSADIVGSSTRSIVTQAGATTGAWTTSLPAGVSANDSDVAGGYALATSSGTVTVRVSLRNSAVMHMGVGAWLIPAADKGATYGWATNFAADADGQASVTLSGSSFVAYGAGDWAATAIASTASTPVATNYRVRVVDSGAYSVYFADWAAQASGTRNYGPAGLSGDDFTGVVFRMDAAAAGFSGTIAGTLPVLGSAVAGATVPPAFSGTVGGTLPSLTSAAVAETGVEATVAGTLPSLSSAATAAFTPPPAYTLTGAASLPPLEGSISAVVDNPGTDGSIAATLPVLGAAMGGAIVPPGFTGTVAAQLPFLGAAGTITTVPPDFDGAVICTLPGLTATVVGAFTAAGGFSGVLVATLPSLTATAVAATLGGTPLNGTNMSNIDLERAYLLGISVDPNEGQLSVSDLRDVVYVDRQTSYAADPATNRSAADVERDARLAASANPNKQFMSLADLRREAWGG